MIKSKQRAEASLEVTLPYGISVAQQGHTGSAGTYLLISAAGYETRDACIESIRSFARLINKEANGV